MALKTFAANEQLEPTEAFRRKTLKDLMIHNGMRVHTSNDGIPGFVLVAYRNQPAGGFRWKGELPPEPLPGTPERLRRIAAEAWAEMTGIPLRTTALRGETRPVIIIANRTYETTAAPTFIRSGQTLDVRHIDASRNRFMAAPTGTDAWEVFEATDA